MDQEERSGDQKRRFSQHDHRQDKHVGEIEGLAGEEDSVFAQRMPGALQISMGREEKVLKVPDEDIIEREECVEEERIDMLKPVQRRPGFVGREAKDATSRKRIILSVEIDAGVMTPMMEDTPHVRADSA